MMDRAAQAYFDPPDPVRKNCRICGEEMHGGVHLRSEIDLDHWAEEWEPFDEESPELEDYMMEQRGLL